MLKVFMPHNDRSSKLKNSFGEYSIPKNVLGLHKIKVVFFILTVLSQHTSFGQNLFITKVLGLHEKVVFKSLNKGTS